MALIYYLTHVHLDDGARELLPAECERVGISKPLIVTDAGVRAPGPRIATPDEYRELLEASL